MSAKVLLSRFLGGAVAVVLAALLSGCAMPAPFKVMTFNIRYGTADDGADAWPQRRAAVVALLRDEAAAVVGLQEVLAFQLDELTTALPEYQAVGVGRDDGRRAGEFAPILYRREMFELVGTGTFWLSATPERVGSVGWDAALPRIATWARLRFKRSPQNEVHVINTHFDHAGERARRESAKLLRRTVETMAGDPLIVMGDFNAAPGSAVYQTLTRDTGNLAELRDPLAEATGVGGTFHGFRGGTDGPRIDWVLVNRRFVVTEARIDRRATDGRYPSDHYPVAATVRLLPTTRFGMM